MANWRRVFSLKISAKKGKLKMGVFALVLAAISLSVSPVQKAGSFTGEPLIIISSVRQIDCDEGKGTGWMIRKDILVTANHVAELTNCVDAQTKESLRRYKKDDIQDIALMTGRLPDAGEYMKYSCQGYKPGHEYDVYGWSSIGYPIDILRQNRVVATNKFSKKGETYRDGTEMPVMREFSGYTVPGMSGGPYTKDGIAYGIVTAGHGTNTFFGYISHPEVFSTDLKDTFLCATNPKGSTPSQS
jgi:hypothetical protein